MVAQPMAPVHSATDLSNRVLLMDTNIDFDNVAFPLLWCNKLFFCFLGCLCNVCYQKFWKGNHVVDVMKRKPKP